MPNLNQMIELNIGLDIFAMLVTLFLIIGVLADSGHNRSFIRSFLALLISDIFMMLGETGIWFFDGKPEMIFFLKMSSLLSFVCGYLVVAFYTYCLIGFIKERTEISLVIAHIVAGLCAVISLFPVISVFNGMLFYFDEAGRMQYTDLYVIVHIFDCTVLLFVICLVLKYRRILTAKGTVSLLAFSVLSLITKPLQAVWDTTPMCLAITLSFVVMYILFHGEITRQLAEKDKQLAEKERQLAEKERQLTESRISTMISQIQPHFIYNTLGTIEQLCLEQPKTASKLVHDFSLYLRGNFSEIDNTVPIRLSREMEHVQHYVDIERIRFPDMTIIFEMHSGEFLLPALSIQPLVENAIKHGLMGLEHGGTVTIATYETDTHYCVRVEDDGIGFDTSRLQRDLKHIGIRNIRKRLKIMCDGVLMVDSVPGKGTIALIKIPKEDEEI